MEAITHDLEQAPHVPLLEPPSLAGGSGRRPLKGTLVIFGSIVLLLSLVALIISQSHEPLEEKENNLTPFTTETMSVPLLPRGVAEGVSAKSNSFLSEKPSYNWTNAMLSWQRTTYHFQPERNWMNGKRNLIFLKKRCLWPIVSYLLKLIAN